ncbi:MAG: Fe-S cluster assembly protein SufD [Chitinophagaceae bacterium]
MSTIENIKERFADLQKTREDAALAMVRNKAIVAFNQWGIPTVKHEEWKYTRISAIFNTDFDFPLSHTNTFFNAADLDSVRLPGYKDANELVFIDGIFSSRFSVIRSGELVVLSLAAAAEGEFAGIVAKYFGDSANYLKDGINALNTALEAGGIFVHVKNGQVTEHPVYIYNVTDARSGNVLSQPRSLFHVGENAQIKIAETYVTLGTGESLSNQVMEIIVEKDAYLEHYKIQNDASHTNQVSTTHIRQVGKSLIHNVVITLNGNIVRNNINVIMDAERCEAHLYGLYLQKGKSHVDNHTIVDNVKPNCYSNELYKGILDDEASGVFNGKIFVRPQAQKTNAYQSNKNILLSANASVNTKPQLEILADDVKCSHGCTVGRLNEEGLFYLQSRGIREETARALLLNAYAIDILEHIKLEPIHAFVDRLISERLELA